MSGDRDALTDALLRAERLRTQQRSALLALSIALFAVLYVTAAMRGAWSGLGAAGFCVALLFAVIDFCHDQAKRRAEEILTQCGVSHAYDDLTSSSAKLAIVFYAANALVFAGVMTAATFEP